MTTDDFETAARAKSERLAPTPEDGDRFHVWNTRDMRDHGVEMAEWARTYLAEQEPTHEEVIAATLELYVRSHHSTGRQTPFESLDHEEQVAWVEDGRAVLSAARAMGRDAR